MWCECNSNHLLRRAAVRSGGERQEHGVAQEVQVGLETGDAKPRPQINGQAALDQSADQVAEAARERVFLAARLDLIQLHLQPPDNMDSDDATLPLNINDHLHFALDYDDTRDMNDAGHF